MQNSHAIASISLSLGKNGVRSLTTWRTDGNHASDNKIAITVTDATHEDILKGENDDFGRLGCGESRSNILDEQDGLKPAPNGLYPAPRRPAGSMRSEAPDTDPSARNSINTLISALGQEFGVPSSANSEATLFDFSPEDSFSPQAKSTPQRTPSRSDEPDVPPVPKTSKESRRSSIVYIKSDQESAPTKDASRPIASPLSNITSRVRPLAPKARASKVHVKSSETSPKGGLRPLSLLQNRDANQASPKPTRPLKKKSKTTMADENDPQGASPRSLKPLRLVRSETTKERAALRAREVLPDVVVRPPSQHSTYGY